MKKLSLRRVKPFVPGHLKQWVAMLELLPVCHLGLLVSLLETMAVGVLRWSSARQRHFTQRTLFYTEWTTVPIWCYSSKTVLLYPLGVIPSKLPFLPGCVSAKLRFVKLPSHVSSSFIPLPGSCSPRKRMESLPAREQWLLWLFFFLSWCIFLETFWLMSA